MKIKKEKIDFFFKQTTAITKKHITPIIRGEYLHKKKLWGE
jgi:hypothetical protein